MYAKSKILRKELKLCEKNCMAVKVKDHPQYKEATLSHLRTTVVYRISSQLSRPNRHHFIITALSRPRPTSGANLGGTTPKPLYTSDINNL